MNTGFKNWFLDYTSHAKFIQLEHSLSNINRKYEYYNIQREEVPFDSAFNRYLENLVGNTDFTYDLYHVHKWKVGSYFDPHIDARDNRKFAYVCELKESKCKTKLLVNDKQVEESVFSVYTEHKVPEIKLGERISLTVFGKNIKNKRLL